MGKEFMTPQSFDPREEASARLIEEVKAAVLDHFAVLNSGDVDGRVRHYLPGATGFSMNGRPLVSEGLDPQQVRAKSDAGRKHSLECRDLRVKLYGDTAVITFYVSGTITPLGGKPKVINGRSTSVRIRHEGSWKIAHTHGSPLVATAR